MDNDRSRSCPRLPPGAGRFVAGSADALSRLDDNRKRYNARMAGSTTAYRRFADFYPFYLSQHADRTCRRLHFAGTTLGLVAVLHAFATLDFWWLLAGLFAGYLFAWIGHFFFEKNRPATFTHPFYSFLGDWVMWKEMLTGRIRF
jgi:hypothetical protein